MEDYSLFDKLAYPIIIINKKFHVLFLNNAAKEEYYPNIKNPEQNPKIASGIAYKCFDVTGGKDKSCVSDNENCPLKELINDKAKNRIVVYHNNKGKNFRVEVSRDDRNESVFIESHIDISEFKSEIENLKNDIKTSEVFKEFFYKNSQVMVLYDPDTKQIEDVNEAAVKFYGYSKEELVGKTVFETINPFINIKAAGKHIKLVTNNNQNVLHGIKHKLKKGGIKDVQVNSSIISFNNKHLILSTVSDITEKLKIEKQRDLQSQQLIKNAEYIKQISEFNALLGKINQLMARTDDEETLLQSFCDMAIGHAHLRLAWAGRPDENDVFKILAAAGTTDYLKGHIISSNPDIPEGRGVTGRAWRERKPYYNQSFKKNSFMRPWKDIALKYGILSNSAYPIYRNGNIWAVLTVYHADENFFKAELQGLLEQISRDVGFGLDRIDLIRQENSANAIKDALLKNTTAGVALMNYPERVYVQVNQAFLDIIGYAHENDILGHNARKLYPDDKTYYKVGALAEEILSKDFGSTIRDIPYLRADGNIVYTDISGNKIKTGNNYTQIIWTLIDVTERHRLSKELERQALYDMLTGLPNRRSLDKEIDKAMARAKRSNNMVAVAVLDLDNFKPINDTYGHEAGDKVLQIIGQRLKGSLRKSDFVARLGGDEFVLLIEDFTDKKVLEPIFAKLEKIIREPIALSDKDQVTVGLSMGVCIYPYAGDISSDVLMRYADQALYESKENKSTRSSYYKMYCELSAQE